MITIPELVAKTLGSFLTSETKSIFASSHTRLTELLPYAARLALECIGNSDALYHDIEHSMLVTLAGHDILMGRAMLRPTTAGDYANFIMACLTHDIGYVRGVVQGDEHGSYVADVTGRTIRLPRGSSDAALAPYHVDRSRLFVLERLDSVEELEATRIARAIEYTRFPYSASSNDDLVEEEGLLLRAADLIGQLGDPHYMRKSTALFYEFEEIGLNKSLGYETPADVVYKYPQFYWNNVAPQIQTAIRYLNVTSSGRQWIANLYGNVFRAEHEMNLSGPQPAQVRRYPAGLRARRRAVQGPRGDRLALKGAVRTMAAWTTLLPTGSDCANRSFAEAPASEHFAQTGPVLVDLVRAGSVPVRFAPAGPLLGDFARAGSLPAHFARAGRVGAFSWAGPLVGHLVRPVPGHLERAVPVPARPPKLGIA